MLSDADNKIARHSIILRNTPDDAALSLMGTSSVLSVNRGETVFMQGDAATSLYIVLDGWVKLFRLTPTGTEAVVGVFTRGDSFGEGVAFCDDVYPVTAEAVTNARVMQLRASRLLEMMKDRPELCLAMLASTFRHLRSLVTQIEQLKAQSGPQRIAEFLLDLCPVEEGACEVTLPYDKVLIAGRLGMKPESLSRAFVRLRDIGVRIIQNSAQISDIARLRAYVEEDRANA